MTSYRQHPASSPNAAPRWQVAIEARTACAATLAALLQDSRARTLALLDVYEAVLGQELQVPQSTELNPPLWEMGHIAWFQDYWLNRNPQHPLGLQADPLQPRLASRWPQADALYDSSQVAHASRWTLPLPPLADTRRYAQQVLTDSLELLHSGALANSRSVHGTDNALYFFRLVLFHEDMHCEAWIYMAQSLGMDLPQSLLRPPAAATTASTTITALQCPAGPWQAGWQGSGFAFDNELGCHQLVLPACDMDSHAVRWQDYLPFVDAGGYREPQWWSDAGQQWLLNQAAQGPRYVRRGPAAGGWECRLGSRWHALDLQATAVHLNYFEAQAWCAWAGRALPTEEQWERAAMLHPAFSWGQVWEWTESAFSPYPGFTAHPYREYSAPWFDGRPVLKGASTATRARMAHPRYRNYFEPHRNDILAGFRSCKK